MDREGGGYLNAEITRDGVTVAKGIDLKDPGMKYEKVIDIINQKENDEINK